MSNGESNRIVTDLEIQSFAEQIRNVSLYNLLVDKGYITPEEYTAKVEMILEVFMEIFEEEGIASKDFKAVLTRRVLGDKEDI